MENRATARRIVGIGLRIAAAALAAGCARGAPAPPLAVGDPSPELLAGGPGVHVVWLVREGDLLGCRTRARELRALGARHPSGIRLTMVVVGESTGLAEGFIRRERMDATLRTAADRAYRDQLGATPLPALLVIDAGRVSALWSGAPEDPPAEAAAVLARLVPE
jgi:hypothetical protein